MSPILVSGAEMKQARQNAVIEVLVGPDSSVTGRGLEDLGWRRKYTPGSGGDRL